MSAVCFRVSVRITIFRALVVFGSSPSMRAEVAGKCRRPRWAAGKAAGGDVRIAGESTADAATTRSSKSVGGKRICEASMYL